MSAIHASPSLVWKTKLESIVFKLAHCIAEAVNERNSLGKLRGHVALLATKGTSRSPRVALALPASPWPFIEGLRDEHNEGAGIDNMVIRALRTTMTRSFLIERSDWDALNDLLPRSLAITNIGCVQVL